MNLNSPFYHMLSLAKSWAGTWYINTILYLYGVGMYGYGM